ncbi:MAG: YncE family protein [Verrucomicrobiales bacterium]
MNIRHPHSCGLLQAAPFTLNRSRTKGSRLPGGWALAAALIGWASLITNSSGAAVDPEIAYLYTAGRGEGVSVSKDGHRILVSSPIDISPPSFPETIYSSFVPHVTHIPRAENPFVQTHNPAVPGEATDVAVLPHEDFGLVVVRSDSTSPLNALLAITGDEVLQTLPIPARPDGMKVSPDGRYAVVAVEKGGEIRIYDLSGGAGQIYLTALITKPALAAYYVGMPDRAGVNGRNIEPEAVGISSDSSVALVTIQDSSSVAAIDLTEVTEGQELGLSPEQIGALALKNVIHLPYGFKGSDGKLFGVEPDGVAISPDGSFAMVAHEANTRARHLQGFSVLDLRSGLKSIVADSYCIFDIDPTLLRNTGLTECPVGSATFYPPEANKLPRLDPANFEIVKRGNEIVAALVIERYDPSAAQVAAATAASPNETRGSVLFLDVDEALDNVFPIIERVAVGVSGSKLEGIDSAQHGRWVFVSISNGGGDKGTVARLELLTGK